MKFLVWVLNFRSLNYGIFLSKSLSTFLFVVFGFSKRTILTILQKKILRFYRVQFVLSLRKQNFQNYKLSYSMSETWFLFHYVCSFA